MAKKEKKLSPNDVDCRDTVYKAINKVKDDEYINTCNLDTVKPLVRMLEEAHAVAADFLHTRSRQGGSSAKGKNRKKE